MTEEEMDLKYERSEKFDDYYFGRLKMCGCGNPNMIKNFIYELLINHRFYMDNVIDYEIMNSKRSDIIKSVDPDIIFEIIFHMLEEANVLEHGTSVYGSWFTDDGKEFITLLEEFKDGSPFD